MDFKDHPLSITEIKSDRTNLGSDWTPRDALIALLLDIDSGARDVQSIFIAARVAGSSEGACRPFFSVAASDPIDALGTIELAKMAYVRSGYEEE